MPIPVSLTASITKRPRVVTGCLWAYASSNSTLAVSMVSLSPAGMAGGAGICYPGPRLLASYLKWAADLQNRPSRHVLGPNSSARTSCPSSVMARMAMARASGGWRRRCNAVPQHAAVREIPSPFVRVLPFHNFRIYLIVLITLLPLSSIAMENYEGFGERAPRSTNGSGCEGERADKEGDDYEQWRGIRRVWKLESDLPASAPSYCALNKQRSLPEGRVDG